MKNILKTALLCAGALALFTACESDGFTRDAGVFPDSPGAPTGALYAEGSLDPEGQDFVISADKTINLVYRLDKPAEADVTVTLEPGTEDDVNAYNDAKGLSNEIPFYPAEGYNWENRYRLLPETNYSLPATLTLTVPKGQTVSQTLAVEVKYSDALIPDENTGFGTKKWKRCPWMLPFKVVDVAGPVAVAEQTLGIGVRVGSVDSKYYDWASGEYLDIPLDTEYLTVFYLNTTYYQPLLADTWMIECVDGWTFEVVWRRTFGNIVNLRVNTLEHDAATGRAMFVPSPDMRYVLEHAVKYIRPLQDKGRKVCLSIEEGRTGLGFCNLSDAQIADFAWQVADVVNDYALDGVNLFDRNTGYGKEGMPPVNTTSYPKLIKALREALGADKLITVADYEEPTEYFWDTEATGGIAVGDYIDYAWSGYMSEDEPRQLLDPYNTVIDPDVLVPDWGEDYSIIVSEHVRKPIAGLAKEKFGHFAIPHYAVSNPNGHYKGAVNFNIWKQAGYNPNNIIVFSDLISNHQNAYEGANFAPWGELAYFFEGSWDWTYMYMAVPMGELGSYYDYMLKDW